MPYLSGRRAPNSRGIQAALNSAPDNLNLPVIPISFVKHGRVLHYFSMVATVGTPQTVAAKELRLECMFPVDGDLQRRSREWCTSRPR